MKCKAEANRSSPGISRLQADHLMDFQEFLSTGKMRQRSVGANRQVPASARRASYPHEGTLVSCVIVCLADAYKQLGNVGLEAVLVDSEALDL